MTHTDQRRRHRRLAQLGAALALASGSIAASSDPVSAEIRWDDPPTCFTGSEWHRTQTGPGELDFLLGQYTHAGQYEQRRYYSGGYEVQYIWVYYVESWIHLVGMVPAGRAEKLCGAEWHPYTA